MACSIAEGFAAFGVISASYIALKLALSILSGLKAYILNLGIDVTKLGNWAVITGATDGIGKAYAQELARRGMKIVLISRSQEKLDTVADEIQSEFKCETKTISADFTNGLEMYDRIRKELAGLDIGVLVNNVGMSYSHPYFFAEVPNDKDVMALINVNMTSVTMMTRLVLPGMLEKRNGAIINVSSSSCLFPVPMLTQYSASKAYMDYFSRGLQAEYAGKGVIIQSVCPFFVATKLSKIKRTNIMVPGPSTYARCALNTLGVQDRTFGCLSHGIQGYITQMLPEFVLNKLSLSGGQRARKRALKRMEKNQ